MGKPLANVKKEEFIDLYINKKLSGLEIARHFKIGRTTVSRYIKRYGLEPRSISEIRKNKKWSPSAEQIQKSIAYNKAHSGEKSPSYKGGHINKDGYKVIRKDGKYYKEHRYIMMQHIGRELSRNEDVHHINGNKLDNHIENLQLLTKSEHSQLHWDSAKRANQSRKISKLRSERFWSSNVKY